MTPRAIASDNQPNTLRAGVVFTGLALVRLASIVACLSILSVWNPALAGSEESAQATAGSQPTASFAPAYVSDWSLPFNGSLRAHPGVPGQPGESSGTSANKPRLQARVSVFASGESIAKRVDQLLDIGIARSPEAQALDRSVSHYRSTTQRTASVAKDALDTVTDYRGISMSTSAGKTILGQDQKPTNRGLAEYQRQIYIDKLHVRLVSSMMQLAMGLGISDNSRRQQVIAAGLKSLNQVVGPEEADRTLEMVTAWSQNISVPQSIFSGHPWDTIERDTKLKCIVEHAASRDPVVDEIKQRVGKYANRTKAARVTTTVVQTALNAISFAAPGWVIGPCADLALAGFIQANGGTEEKKLREEIYLSKRLESRSRVIGDEAALAVDNYRFAVVTHNSPLLAFSEALVGNLSGQEAVPEVFGLSVLPTEKKSVVSTVEHKM